MLRRSRRGSAMRTPSLSSQALASRQKSGVPTFRGTSGLCQSFRPEDLATPQTFAGNRARVGEMTIEPTPRPAIANVVLRESSSELLSAIEAAL